MVRNLAELGPALQKIVVRLQANQKLLKLLYYTDKDPLHKADLSAEDIKEKIFEKLIKVVPRVGPKETANSVIVLRIAGGERDRENDEFRNISLVVEVFVPLTQWIIKDPNLRPFSIMGEVQRSLVGKTINGIGQITGGDFALNFLTEEISCYEMSFEVINYG